MSTIDQRMRANDLINGNGYGVDGRKNMSIPEPDEIVYTTAEEAAGLPGMLGIIASKTLRAKGWYTATVEGVKTLYVV